MDSQKTRHLKRYLAEEKKRELIENTLRILETRINKVYLWKKYPEFKVKMIDLSIRSNQDQIVLLVIYLAPIVDDRLWKSFERNVGHPNSFLELTEENVSKVDQEMESIIKDIMFRIWKLSNNKKRRK